MFLRRVRECESACACVRRRKRYRAWKAIFHLAQVKTHESVFTSPFFSLLSHFPSSHDVTNKLVFPAQLWGAAVVNISILIKHFPQIFLLFLSSSLVLLPVLVSLHELEGGCRRGRGGAGGGNESFWFNWCPAVLDENSFLKCDSSFCFFISFSPQVKVMRCIDGFVSFQYWLQLL